ncbi:hypothetical protein A2U01_0065940, partial [Trifolium medium]|nr:hypothetical protein [Trifolium medium]
LGRFLCLSGFSVVRPDSVGFEEIGEAKEVEEEEDEVLEESEES